MKTIPYGRHDITESDIDAVKAVLMSDWLTQGPAIESFEKAVAKLCDAKSAVAVSNATAALHIACLAAGLKKGDLLWTVPNTFVASANCALYCGAEVDFVDIDPSTLNMSVSALAEKLARAEKQGRLPKVLIPVHFAGLSCEMKEIGALARKYGVLVIEDASHAVGGSYENRPIGCGQYSDMTVFSFHPVKIFTTGEGGMVLTQREDLHKRLSLFRTHGITRDPALMTETPEGPWYYQQVELGYNFRMTDMQAALGLAQLDRISTFIARRRVLVRRYVEAFSGLPLKFQDQSQLESSAHHLFVINLQLELLNKTRAEIFNDLRTMGIGVNVHYIPVHTQPYYRKMGFNWGDFPHAEAYYRGAITLPLYYGLSDQDQDRVISCVREAVS